MNQANESTVARVGASAENPTFTFILRRYVWLVVGGTLLGTLIGAGLWYYWYKYEPMYTAKRIIMVLPPRGGIPMANGSVQNLGGDQDEIARFIKRQMTIITSEDVLGPALEKPAFKHPSSDPSDNRPSRWLSEHPTLRTKYLRDAMDVSTQNNSDFFTLNLTTNNNIEAAALLNAIVDTYYEVLQNTGKENERVRLKELQDIVDSQASVVKSAQNDLTSFRDGQNISAVMNRHNVELSTLSEMDNAMIRLENDVIMASANLDNIKSRDKQGKLELTPEMEQYVEQDQQLRYLEQTKLQLMQDKAVARIRNGENSDQVRDLTTRIGVVDDQINQTRDRLRRDARVRMQDQAESSYKALVAQYENLKQKRDEEERKVKDMDSLLVQYHTKEEDLKSQQEILDRVREQLRLRQLEQPTDDKRVRLGTPAPYPDIADISSPVWWKDIPLGVILGFGASFGLAWLIETTNTRVRTPHDITRNLQLPLLGFVPDEEDDVALTGSLATSVRTSPSSMIAESFRQIRGQLVAQANGHPIRTLLVASVAPNGGATTVASNLANGMALNHMRTLLVDSNFYRPGLDQNYSNVPAVGLIDVLKDPKQLDSAIVASAELPNLHLLGAGTRQSDASGEILSSQNFVELLKTLRSRYDMIIFDGAPLNLVSDSITLGSKVDGVLAIVRAGEVSRGTVARVRDQLRQVRAHLLGIVLNAAQTHGAGYFKENYRSFYRYAAERGRATTSSTN